jgi:hypothetical protein
MGSGREIVSSIFSSIVDSDQGITWLQEDSKNATIASSKNQRTRSLPFLFGLDIKDIMPTCLFLNLQWLSGIMNRLFHDPLDFNF